VCVKERLSITRAPPEMRKKRNNRLMRIRRVVSHEIRPAPSPPEASRSTSDPPSRSPIITVAMLKCILCLVFVILFKLFIARCYHSYFGLATIPQTKPNKHIMMIWYDMISN
jgi:hypothetical protein